MAAALLVGISAWAADWRSLVLEAERERERANLGRAEQILRKAVAVAPAELEPKVLLAETLAWQEKFEEAESWYRQALQIHPTSRRPRLGLARTYLWTGRYEEARSLLRSLIEADPRDLDAREALARSRYWEGDFRSAAREFRSILDEDATRSEAERDLAAIRSQARGSFRIGAAHRDDDQPFQVRRFESGISLFSDPLTRWDVSAGEYRLTRSPNMRAGVPTGPEVSRADLPYVTLGADIVLPSARLTLSPRLEVLEHADGEVGWLGGARLSRRLGEHHHVSAAFEETALLLNREAIDDHATVARSELAWRYAAADGTLASVRAAHLDFSDRNQGEAIDGWVLFPVWRRGTGVVSVGASAAWRDTDETRFRAIRTAATQLGPLRYRYRYAGVYDPYWTPLDLREIRGILGVSAPLGGRGELRVRGTAGTAMDRGISFGPNEGATPLPSSILSFPFTRRYSPWEVSAEVDVRIAPGSLIQLGWTRSHTVHYEADEIQVTLVGRF